MKELIDKVVAWLEENGVRVQVMRFYGGSAGEPPRVVIILTNVYWGRDGMRKEEV